MAAGAISAAASTLLFLLIMSASGADIDANIPTDPGDVAVMRVLSNSLGASSSLGWSNSSDPCTWDGVSCGFGRVTAIQIGNRSVAGTLPTGDVSLRNLTSLSRLELMDNSISGTLPFLSGLANLAILRLHHNNFSSFPPGGPGAFFAGLTSLLNVSLDGNPLPAWQLPESLQDASRLTSLDANNVNLTGNIPDFLGTAFPSLYNLMLSYNSLTGEIPPTFSQAVSLRNLGLTQNSLSGGIDSIANTTSLEALALNMNRFTGRLPEFSQLGNIQVLNIRDNQFTGPVPSSLTSLPKLNRVILTNNLFQGPVPVFKDGLYVDMIVGSERFCLTEPGECDPRVNALLSIAGSFGYPIEFAQGWTGNDPCSASWLGITCDNSKNVTIVNLSNLSLNGTISPDFALLTSLQKLVLSNNNLTGVIPPELTKLNSLQLFDVSNNSLWGKVPSFGATVTVLTEGNPDIGKDGPPGGGGDGGAGGGKGGGGGNSGSGGKRSSSSSLGLIVGVAAAAIFVVLLVVLLVLLGCRRRKHKDSGTKKPHRVAAQTSYSGSDAEMLKHSVSTTGCDSWESNSCSNASDIPIFDPGNLKISIEALRRVTNDFSEDNILGRGGFGTVYKGVMGNGTLVAVKRMEGGHGVTESNNKGLTEFQSEISVLTSVRHKHLVSLLGYCLQENEKILVYEYMSQGNLSDHLFNWAEGEGTKPLEWKRRLSIALDVARGVEYLHNLAHRTFIHRDLKPSNILLGDDMRAKVADFGLVRLAPEGTFSVETRLAGTFGYLAPEYATTGRLTTKADIYSFGVILMELISGRRALDNTQPEESAHLVTWFRRLQIRESISKVVDPLMEHDEETMAHIEKVAELAAQCCVRNPHERPAMSHVVNVLSTLVESWMPTNPNLDDGYMNDFSVTLPGVLARWQNSEDSGQADCTTSSSSYIQSLDNSLSSIPTTSRAFAKAFTPQDAR